MMYDRLDGGWREGGGGGASLHGEIFCESLYAENPFFPLSLCPLCDMKKSFAATITGAMPDSGLTTTTTKNAVRV